MLVGLYLARFVAFVGFLRERLHGGSFWLSMRAGLDCCLGLAKASEMLGRIGAVAVFGRLRATKRTDRPTDRPTDQPTV